MPTAPGPAGQSEESRALPYEERAPSGVLSAAAAWRIEALRDHRERRENPHLARVDVRRALPQWRSEIRAYLRALHQRRVNLLNFACGGPNA